jgi:DNA-binding transcriptional MocR family regulator
MPGGRVEPFQLAVRVLREKLHAGEFRAGARIAVMDLAEALQLSATPVREAMSRLAGEGLLEDRRGQGFFVRVLTAAEIADLFRLNLALLTIAQDPRRTSFRRPRQVVGDTETPKPDDPIRETERRFESWIAMTGSRVLLATHRSVQAQLGPVRRLESLLLADLALEAEALRACDPPGAGAVDLGPVRRFHSRRIALAPRLAELLQVER